MISNLTSKGKTTEAVILAALVRLGQQVLIPWAEERYDLALDDGGRLVRIQRTTGRLRVLQNERSRCSSSTGRRWATPDRSTPSRFTARRSNVSTWCRSRRSRPRSARAHALRRQKTARRGTFAGHATL